MTRPTGALSALPRGDGRTVDLTPLMLVGFALGVVLLFALAMTVVLDPANYAPAPGELQSSFAARTDPTEPYAPQPEMLMKPVRPAIAAPTPAS
jgi:hypothetical protein